MPARFFQALLEQTLSVKRITRVMSLYQFVLALVLGLYVAFARLNQLRFIACDPLLTGILKVHGDRPSGKEIVAHLESAWRALPASVNKIFARADAGFYCWEAVAAYEQAHCQFVLVARKTRRLLEQLQQAEWKPSPHSDADAECEFFYQPQGWARACRFVALRYEKESETDEVEQYQLFATSSYAYRVFVTNLAEPIAAVVWFYNQRAGAENLIKEANNDAGLAAHPSRRFDMNRNHFQLVMLAYNLNCWLLLFQREADATVETLRHTTLATARLRFLFVAAVPSVKPEAAPALTMAASQPIISASRRLTASCRSTKRT